MIAENMTRHHLAWLWAASAHVCGGTGLVSLSRRTRFLARSLRIYEALKPLLDAPTQSPLAQLLRERPETVGAVIWPYQCCGWNARTRLDRIRDHYAVVEKIGGTIDFSVNRSVPLINLAEIHDSLQVVLDQPKWFMREGQLAINLFLAETRIYSLVFSLFHDGDEISAFVGAIQGRNIEGALEQYRELTKAAHGMRPRDLLIETFRMFCAVLGIRHFFAVSDQYRDFQSGYFGDPAAIKAHVNNYDEIWADRGGVRVDAMFYRLNVTTDRRELGQVPAKKRSMYRQRYAMLDGIRLRMEESCRTLNGKAAFGNRAGGTEPSRPALQGNPCSSMQL